MVLVAPLVFRAPSGPAAREIATREPAARSGRSRSPPVPSGPSGALHTSGAWCTDVWLGASARSPAWPCRRPRVSHLGPVGQLGRLSETAIAFARSCSCGIETGIAFAGAGRASNETGIAFAGENWVFLARFSLVLVLPVSRGAVQGRALVMVVSRWPVSVVVEVSLVSPSPPQCVLCAKKFALRGLVVGVSAKKFAHCAHNGSKLALSGVLGEVFRGNAAGGAVLGEVFRGRAAGGAVLGEFFRGPAVVGSHRANIVAPQPWLPALLLAVLTLRCAATPTKRKLGTAAPHDPSNRPRNAKR